MAEATDPETFIRVTIRAERNGYVVRGEHPSHKRPDDRDTPCWLAADRDELADLVRRLVAEPPEGRAR
jgi:hypothetical protein